jgi:opacity protein-like surface antigen
MSAALLGAPAVASAQGFGVGGRMAWVKANTDGVDVDAVRFTGGQIRLVSKRWGLEVSMDRHSESFELLNQKVTETPIQTSLLLRLGSGKVAPFLLGGPGWYKRKVELIDGPEDADVKTTEFGWHAGAGLEVHAGRHVGIHGDYRFTFLKFGGNDAENDGGGGFLGSILPNLPGLPSHRGSQWTLGVTVYF